MITTPKRFAWPRIPTDLKKLEHISQFEPERGLCLEDVYDLQIQFIDLLFHAVLQNGGLLFQGLGEQFQLFIRAGGSAIDFWCESKKDVE